MYNPGTTIHVFWKKGQFCHLESIFEKNNFHNDLSEFNEKFGKTLSSISGIIILCELNFKSNGNSVKLQDMIGIKLAQELRLQGVTIPILFTSFLSRKQIHSNKPEREIINAIGHDFIRLPANPQEFVDRLEKMNSLSDLELYDIQNSYCRKEGMIRELAHRLSNIKYFDLDKKSSADLLIMLDESIRQISGIYSDNHIDFITIFNNKYSEITEKNISDAVAEISRYGERLISEYSPAIDVRPEEKKRNWKLLWLDDESDKQHKLIEYLKESNVGVLLCTSAAEAQQLLEDDWKNENRVHVIVADYRLYKQTEEGKVHQQIQGYTFLKQISELGKMIKLVALSALPRKFLLHSFKHYNVAAQIYSKKDYLEDDNTLRLLCTELVELGDENEEAISRLPRITSENWKFFEPFYIAHRNSLKYKEIEKFISEKAKSYCEGLMLGEYKFELSGYTVALGVNKPTQEAKEKLKVGVKSGKKNDENEKNAVSKDPANQKYFNEFINKMICRRVAIWYTRHNPYFTLKDVHKILKGKNYLGTESEVAARNQVNTNLALSLKEFPWNMTLEERNWLLDYMNMDEIKNIEKIEVTVLNNVLGQISIFLKQQKLNSLSSDEHFSKYFIGSRPIFGSNFIICKTFMYQLYNFLRNNKEFDLIKNLHDEIKKWDFIKEETTSLKKFKSFVEDFNKKLRLTKPIKENATVNVGHQEYSYSDIVLKVLAKITEHYRNSRSPENEAWEKEELKTNAYLFFHDETLDKTKLHSETDCTNALLEYHKQQFNELSNSIGCPYDDIKVRSRKKKTDPSDNE